MANVFETSKKELDPNLIYPFVYNRFDICPHCGAQRVELFSFNGYPQNYRDAVTSFLQGNNVEFNKYEIRTMKCRSCHKEFVIDWYDDKFPRPMKSINRSKQFFDEFVNGN